MKKKLGKKIAVFTIVTALVVAMLPILAFAGVLESDVCKIGDTGYATLGAAVTAANDGDTIELLKNIKQSNSIVIDKDITLDLNGKEITVDTSWAGASPTAQALFYVKSGGKFTVNDSVGTGIIDSSSKSTVYSAIFLTIKNQNDESKIAKLVINGGTIRGYYYGIGTNGTRHNTDITVNGGIITAIATDGYTSIYHPNKGKLTITGGKFVGYDGIGIKGGAPVTISGGEFVATGTYVEPTEAQGSGINNVGCAVYVEGNYGYGPAVNITGGKFTTTDPDAPVILSLFNDDEEKTISVSGGTFSSEPDKEYLAEGFVIKKLADGTYGVVDPSVPETADSNYWILWAILGLLALGAAVTVVARKKEY